MVHMHCGGMDATKDSNNNENGGGNGGDGKVVCVDIPGGGGGDGGSGGYDGDSGGDGLANVSRVNIRRAGCGGTSSNGPIELELPCPMSGITRLMIDDNHDVPSFLIKLYSMVDDKATNSIISWASSRKSFVIFDEPRFVSEILPSYYKNQSFDNFISQLTSYGFKKNERGRSEFEHEHFQEGKLHLLIAIKSNKKQYHVINKPHAPINEFKATFENARQGQKQISYQIRRFKYDMEKLLSENETISKSVINNFLFAFSTKVGEKRTFFNIDRRIDLVEFEKDFKSICDRFEVLDSGVDCLKTLDDLTKKLIPRHYQGGVGDGRHIPRFLDKLYNMVSKEELDDHISWKLPHRESFIIWDINKFASHVLPMYFKHTNFSSFHSQLNLYCFKKVSWERHEYANEWFQEGRYEWLRNIKRRSKGLRGMGSLMSCSTMEISNNRLKKVQQEQDSKLIWLSNYEKQMKSLVLEFKETIINMGNIVDGMINKSNENLGKVKKAKLDIGKNIMGNGKRQELEVNEVGDIHATSKENNNLGAQSYSKGLVDKLNMEDDWFTFLQILDE